MERETLVETTLGDLILALTEEAMPYVGDEKDAYKVVAFALVRLLYNSGETPRGLRVWH
ncbi:MAG TPA: hypothetical protein VNL14_02595 [Candidatus Acidoferrales bacterium]|nr:hypothetical protein [Candidatus Acidoferrales bacterium]